MIEVLGLNHNKAGLDPIITSTQRYHSSDRTRNVSFPITTVHVCVKLKYFKDNVKLQRMPPVCRMQLQNLNFNVKLKLESALINLRDIGIVINGHVNR